MQPPVQSAGRRLLIVSTMVAGPIVITAIMLRIAWAPAHPATGGLADSAASSATAHFLLALALMLGTAYAGGRLAMLLRQPAVIGELAVGVLLGPSVFGALAGGLRHWLFAGSSATMVHGLAELGLVVFMAGVGMDFAGSANCGKPGDSLVAASSLLVPFAAGAMLATPLAGQYLGPADSRPAFVLFLGCVLGVTAFPVLAKLISDTGLAGSRVAQLSMYSAAMGDGAIWVLLLLVGAYAGAGLGWAQLWPSLTVIVVLVAALTQCGRMGRLARAVERGRAGLADRRLAPAIMVIAVAAAITAFGGVHEVAGAFLAGVLLRQMAARHSRAVQDAMAVAKYVLFPLFLVQFGMGVDFTALPLSAGTLLVTLAIVAVGSLAKVLGAGGTAWLTGMAPRDSMTVGTLAVSRGMTELVVLQIGRQMGIIDSAMFTMLTFATMLMTMLVAPAVQLLSRRPRPAATKLVVESAQLVG